MHTLRSMEFEWDSAKSTANRLKQGVDFADAAIALEDEFALTQPDPDGEGEDRFVSLGLDPLGRLLVTDVYSPKRQHSNHIFTLGVSR